MENLGQKQFSIKNWQVAPDEGVLSRDDETIHLEPKVMEVLVYFASRPGEVVTREDLERDVWKGALVGYDAVTATVIKLRKALGDNAKQPRIIATIPKKGYQLISPVSFHDDDNKRVPTGSTESITAQQGLEKKPRLNLILAGIGMALVIVLLVTWLTLLELQNQQSDSLTSIVVLPIENLGAGEEHDVFVDGITEDIITDLSRVSNLMVFASSTTFKYKDRQVTPQELRDELDVDFALKGNARRYGNEIRINVQLINTDTGFNVWAERYDRELEEVFAVQDEVAGSLVQALAINISSEERNRLAQRATDNLKAYEYFLEGQRLSREYNKQANEQAIESYRRAIEIDPTYGRAYGAMAYSLSLAFLQGWTDTPRETINRAISLAEQGVGLDNSIPQTYWSLGYVYMRNSELEKAENAVAESIRIAPNYADGYGLLALINNHLGRSEKALEYATRGMKLNPFYTWDYLYNYGRARYSLGHYQQAIEALEKAQLRNENAIAVKNFLAAAYVQAGRIDDAEWTIEQVQILNPETTLTHLANVVPLTDPELKARFLEDLRQAGLPE